MFAKRTNWNLQPNRYTEALEAHRAANQPVLDLTASNPTAAGISYESADVLGPFSDPRSLEYHPDARGLRVAREAVALYYAERGVTVNADDLILTPSTSEAYTYAFRLLCDPGDRVLIPAPSYPLFQFLADLQDVELVPYQLLYDHGWQLDLHSLNEKIDANTRAIVVVNPNNPTGSYVKEEEAGVLGEICRERELAIVADEVFLDYALTEAQPLSFAANAAALTLTMSGLSKIAGLPQMKFSWMAVSGPALQKQDAQARLEVISDTYLSMNAPMQYAAPVWLERRRHFQQQLLTRVAANLKTLDALIAADPQCERLALEGGWYAVLRVPVTGSDEDLAISLLQATSVLVHPGHFYDFSTDGYLVVSLITPELEFQAGIKRLLEHLKSRLGKIEETA